MVKLRRTLPNNTGLKALEQRKLNLQRAPVRAEVILVQKAEKKARKPIGATNEIETVIVEHLLVEYGLELFGEYDEVNDTYNEFTSFPLPPFYTAGDIIEFPILVSGDNIFVLVQNISDDTFNSANGYYPWYIYRSQDGGLTWDIKNLPQYGSFFTDIHIGVDGRIWIAQEYDQDIAEFNLRIYYSDDAADSWVLNYNQGDTTYEAVGTYIGRHPTDENRIAIIAGTNTETYLFVTTNHGVSWTQNLVASFRWTFNGESPIVEWLPNGRLVIAFTRTTTTDNYAFYSDDDGATFTQVVLTSGLTLDSTTIGNSVFIGIRPDSFPSPAPWIITRGDGATWTDFSTISKLHSIGQKDGVLYYSADNSYYPSPSPVYKVVDPENSWSPEALTSVLFAVVGYSKTYKY